MINASLPPDVPTPPSPPYPERPPFGGDVSAHRRAMVVYRWRCAIADYQIGRDVGAFSISEDWQQILTQIFCAYLVADAQG